MLQKPALLCLISILLTSCIRPQNYHLTPNSATVAIQFPDQKLGKKHPVTYFRKALAYESYIEFNAEGQLFDPRQVEAALGLINNLKHPKGSTSEQAVMMLLFVHGWKNNASEQSGNVWGFRRVLDLQAAKQNVPVIGVYIGWPGDATRFGKFFSFWNRESVADAVGAGYLDEVLEKLLIAVKGPGYLPAAGAPDSTAILIGHSFGGLVLERAMIRILQQLIDSHPGNSAIPAPADLTLLLNEAGPARQARPLLLELLRQNLTYSDSYQKQYPLLVAMTSDGDAATKIAFPGGEFISTNRPKTEVYATPDGKKLDEFGQSDSLPYNLLSPANMIALRSHMIMEAPNTADCVVYSKVHNRGYCVEKIPDPSGGPKVANTTPYWIMGLPQIFVPDHSSVFRPEMIQLVDDFVSRQMNVPPPPAPPPATSALIAPMNAVPAQKQAPLMLRRRGQ